MIYLKKQDLMQLQELTPLATTLIAKLLKLHPEELLKKIDNREVTIQEIDSALKDQTNKRNIDPALKDQTNKRNIVLHYIQEVKKQ